MYNKAGGLLNGNYIFAATSATFGDELWITDGTREGTKLVKDIATGPGGSGMKSWYNIFSSGSYLLFNAVRAAEGYELWRFDGIEASSLT
jgi:ELWxxDGT repeat protein